MELASFNPYNTLGALFVGVLISCSLFGIVIVQTYIYYTRFPDDRMYLKLMVGQILLCELGHCICVCHAVFHLAVNEYGNVLALSQMPRSLEGAIALSGIIGTVFQVFFVERVRIISGRLWIPLLCWTMSVVRCALTFVVTAEARKMHTVAEFVSGWKWLCAFVLAIGSAVDLFIALSLSYYLNTQKGKTFRR
ncbi:hypothetical protein GALMADRAFT_70137 [Galerina marginata CBS 339.88]|uniref:Integral membrane protein n=1 Tax=Galerina marginata (strain CBS 339.88) TaxID=685588 RepID=A0A067SV44_GALM3|nr:hypothetical protein GALMADRAFT_70137 [Galerina marginata CBS 339.88]